MNSITFSTIALISNSAIFATCFCILFILGRMLLMEMQHAGWYARPENGLAIALFIIFLAGGAARFWSVVLLKLRGYGVETSMLEIDYPVPLYVGALFIVGGACLIRIFSRSNKEWVISVLAIMAFVALMAAI